MAARAKQTKGECGYCGRALTRGGMGRHLATCQARQERIATAAAKSRASSTFFQLQIRDAYSGEYWLHLEMAGSAQLGHLDRYLRCIWLECCGHLSRFTIGDAWRGRKVPLRAKADQAFRRAAELTHIYDFGTTSTTLIRVLGARQGPATTGRPLALMARNEPPEITCMECDGPAVGLCMECVIEEQLDGALCREHASRHPHDNYGEPLPVVNSPRMGMCGYTGPAEPPY